MKMGGDGFYVVNFKIKRYAVSSEDIFSYDMKNKQQVGGVSIFYFVEDGLFKIRYTFDQEFSDIFLQILNQNANFQYPKDNLIIYDELNNKNIIDDINKYVFKGMCTVTLSSTDWTLHENMWYVMFIYDNVKRRSNFESQYFENSYKKFFENWDQRSFDKGLEDCPWLQDTPDTKD